MNTLPSDCKSKILSYLPLYDLLIYSTASKQSLRSTVSAIRERKSNMKKSFYFRGNQIVGATNVVNDCRSIDIMFRGMKHNLDGDVVMLPSVLERLHSLLPNLSSSHPMYQPISDLILLLNEDDDEEEENVIADVFMDKIEREGTERDIHFCVNDQHQLNGKIFEKILHTFQRTIKAHKIHSLVLKSVIQCTDCYNWLRIHDDGNAIDLNFDQYLGDVYITIILMGNISSGIVEGVSEKKWTDSIFHDGYPNNCTLNNNSNYCASSAGPPTSTRPSEESQARIWYQGWIFLHSTLLRSIALTSDERTQLGLSINGAFMKKASPRERIGSAYDSDERIFPPAPFRGTFDSKTMIHLYNKLNFYDGRLTVLFRDFGSLGPTFRGRDSVRSHVIPSMRNLVETINQYNTDGCFDRGRFVMDNSRNQQHHQTIMLLALLHQKSKKTRPMTCAPHKVCMQRFNRSLY